jgi:ABC-type transport system involved in multi-copper enzyme maturation permease subunit
MIWHIIRKELLENLLSLRFVLSLLLIICLYVAIGFVFVSKYTQQMDDYWKRTNKNIAAFSERADQLYKLAFYEQEIWQKPKPLSLCVEGFERHLPNYFKSSLFRTLLPEVRSRSNFLLPNFCDIDWVFIISIPLSFVTLLFTFDIFCGERQAGTLRLILSGSIPRHEVLLGKYFGAVFTLGIPLLMGFLINLIIVISSDIVKLGSGDWLRIIGIALISFIYLSMFLLLGMFVSSRTAHSANSIVILLLVWVCLVVLLPSLGRIVSEIHYKSPSLTEFRKKILESKDEIFREMRAGKFGKNAFESHPDRNHPSNNPPASARFWNAFFGSLAQIYEQYYNKMLTQAFASRNFGCISPTVIYQRASETVAGTGINRCANLYQQIKRYQQDLKDYILTKDIEDPNSLHLLFGFEHSVGNWQAISNKPVDFDTVPKFQERDLSLGQSMKLAIWDIGLLVLFNLVFFAASFVSFLRYDVR